MHRPEIGCLNEDYDSIIISQMFNMQRKNYSYLLLVFVLYISCNNLEDNYSKALAGEWQIAKFLHGEKDYSLTDTYIMSFTSPSNIWIRNIDHDNKVNLYSKYKVSKNDARYVIDIKECIDKNINGNYNIYMDTISDDGESYLIQLTFESEKTYIQAIRHKLKYNSYDEYIEKTGD